MVERGKPVRGAVIHRLFAVLDPAKSLDTVIFNVLADHTSDIDFVDEVSAKLIEALRTSGFLR